MDVVTLGMAKADAQKRYAPLRQPTIVLFGDSRTADCDYNSGTFSYSTNMSWFDWGQASLAGGPVFDVLRNAGIGGNTTTQMQARMKADVLDFKPSHITIWGGTNDGWTSTADVDATVVRMASMMDTARAAGIYVFCISETTANSKGTTYPPLVHYYNEQLRRYCSLNSGVEYWDFNSVVSNPTDANGYHKGVMLRDGLHLSPYGASTIGKTVVAAKLARFASITQLPLSVIETRANNTAARNVAGNPLMQGVGGSKGSGHTGTLPDSWNSSGNVADFSTPARTDGYGNDLKAVLTATSTSSVFIKQTLVTTRVVPGRRYVIEAALGIDDATNVSSIALTCSMFAAGAVEYRRGFGYPVQATAAGDSLATGDKIIRSRIFVAPTDTYTGAELQLRIGPSASTATSTIRLGRLALKQLD